MARGRYPFGDVLRGFREREGMSQSALARTLNVVRNTVSAWERGDYVPKSQTLVHQIAEVLGLDEQETHTLFAAFLGGASALPLRNLPFSRNPFFTGREEILQVLHAQLGANRAVALTQSTALHGLGGVGKTQLALEYAYRHAPSYSAVFWIGAETVETVVSGLMQIAEVLQVPGRDETDQQQIVAAVQRWLSTHRHWLLIWDNLEDLELLPQFLPPVRQGAVLITTRCQALGALAQGMDLLPMEPEEGRLLLLRRAKVLKSSEQSQQLAQRLPAEYAAAGELVTLLGGLPLALDQAGAYIEETGCGLSGYLRRYEHQRHQLLDRRGTWRRDHPQSVVATLRLVYQRVVQRSPVALELLCFCAFLYPDAIPEELLVEGASHLGPVLGPVAADLAQLDQTIAALLSLSLVQRQPETQTLSLHRLVQAVFQERMSQQEQTQWQQRAVQTLNAVFPQVTRETSPKAWGQCERLLPHVLTVASLISDQGGGWDLANVLGKAADYLFIRVQYKQVEPLYQRALHICEQTGGPEHPQVALPLSGLGTLYVEQGKYEQAEPLLLRALHIREQALGSEHPEVARSLNDLAALSYEQGKYEQAEPLYQRALRIMEQALGSEHPEVARSLSNLARLSYEQGKYEQAEPLYQRALYIREQTLGSEHPEMARSLNSLAILSYEQGKYEQVEPLFLRAWHIWEQTLGPEHPQVARPLNNLARFYFEQGKYEQAEPLYQRALGIWEQALGPEHPLVARPLNNLALLYFGQGKYEQAEPLYQRALRIMEQTLGPEHPQLAHPLNGLADLYRDQGKHERAEALYQRALTLREQHLGSHHPETAQTLYDLAILHEKQGHLEEALALAIRALAICSHSLGDAHPKTIASRTLCTQLEHAALGGEPLARASLLGEQPHAQKTSWSLPQAVPASVGENDPLRTFLEDCCELHPRAWCRSADLWQAYEQWVKDAGERFPLSRRAFTTHLKAYGFLADRTKTARVWRGIAVVKETDD